MSWSEFNTVTVYAVEHYGRQIYNVYTDLSQAEAHRDRLNAALPVGFQDTYIRTFEPGELKRSEFNPMCCALPTVDTENGMNDNYVQCNESGFEWTEPSPEPEQ